MKTALVIITALLTIVPGLNAHAQHGASMQTHAGVAISVAGPQHHRPGPPAHRGPPHYRSAPPVHRAPRSSQVSAQARWADWYARTAVAQSHTAWRYGCAQAHPRWSTSYQDHYQWAYRQSAHQGQREVERRERALAQCLVW